LFSLIDASTASTVASLIALAFGWFVFRSEQFSRNSQEFRWTRKVLQGLRQDLSVIQVWASRYEPASVESYRKTAFKDWSNPGRVIYRFNHDWITKARLKPPMEFDAPLIQSLTALDQSITAFFDLLNRFEGMVQGNNPVSRSTYLKLVSAHQDQDSKEPQITQEEDQLRELAFRMNYQIHVGFIGSDRDCDKARPGLYWSYEQARINVARITEEIRFSSCLGAEFQWDSRAAQVCHTNKCFRGMKAIGSMADQA
jgi:hypothetical protein